MTKMLVIGLGEVGAAVCQVLLNAGHSVITHDIKKENITDTIDVMHICFPYSGKFVKQVQEYQKRFSPRLTIIYSTVQIGITKELGKGVVHSPIEGKHPRLQFSTKVFTRWIGCNYLEDGQAAAEIWIPITKVRIVLDSNYTEFLKLASTSKYGLNIVWAQYMSDCAKELDMNYEYVKEFDEDYNDLYAKLHLSQYRKYVLDSPNNEIGGHCVVPNAKLLDQQFSSDLLDEIIAMEKA